MTPEEKNLITSLFQRLGASDTTTKDRDAEQLIQSLTQAQPSAPYLLSQTVLVQEHALQNAQARIAQLEHQLAETSTRSTAQPQSGGFLSGLLHPRSSPPPIPPAGTPAAGSAYAAAPQAPPYPSTVGMPPSAAGGFLKGALTTAAGVAGGALLFEGIQNLLGHHAGPFSSGFGGFGGSGTGGLPLTETENVEVTNNYYGTDSPPSQDSSFLPSNDDSVTPVSENYTNAPDNQDLDAGTDYNDTTTDDSGGDGGDSLA